ncbi:MAG: carboxypeptidase regulatory-like domain-containing protein [Planctomycetes bacterium]|nr:carboxypeptidase regulatory-like domain-containing protein [Planctomycetota bacterium]
MTRRLATSLLLLVLVLVLVVLWFRDRDGSSRLRGDRPDEVTATAELRPRRHAQEPASSGPPTSDEPTAPAPAPEGAVAAIGHRLVVQLRVDDAEPAGVDDVEAILRRTDGEEIRRTMTDLGADRWELRVGDQVELIGFGVCTVFGRPIVNGDYPSPPQPVDRDLACEIVLSTEPRLRGRVVDARDRRGLPGAAIRIEALDGSVIEIETADEKGEFDLVALREDLRDQVTSLVVIAAAEGHAQVEQVVHLDQANGRRDGLVIALDRGHVLSGRVVDETGRGLYDATLVATGGDGGALIAPGLRLLRDHRRTNSERGGGFRIAGLPDLERVVLDVRHHDHGRVRVDLGRLRADREDLVIVMPRQAEIKLRALLPDGTPTDPARLQAYLRHPELGWVPRPSYGIPDGMSFFQAPLGAEVEVRAFARQRVASGPAWFEGSTRFSVVGSPCRTEVQLVVTGREPPPVGIAFGEHHLGACILEPRFLVGSRPLRRGLLRIRLDDAMDGSLELDAHPGLALPAGRRVLRLRVEGFRPILLEVDGAPGDRLGVDLDLEPE